jgi:hypothetical protein
MKLSICYVDAQGKQCRREEIFDEKSSVSSSDFIDNPHKDGWGKNFYTLTEPDFTSKGAKTLFEHKGGFSVSVDNRSFCLVPIVTGITISQDENGRKCANCTTRAVTQTEINNGCSIFDGVYDPWGW